MQKTTLVNFTLGSLLGALIGAMTVVNLPAAILTSVGLFVLYSIWAPPLILKNGGPWTDRVGGGISTFLTMFFGATGPFVSALLKPKLATKSVYIGTFSGCMTVQHGLKTVAFFEQDLIRCHGYFSWVLCWLRGIWERCLVLC